MGGDVIGLVAVILSLGIPIAGMFTYYRVRKLRSEERLAAIARGVNIPMEPEVSQVGRSRRLGILCIGGAVGYIAMFAVISRVTEEHDALAAAAFGLIPLAVGIGFLVDAYLNRREVSA
jgi:dolichyl-phosphate-mannose--protein O-mannosyl transferase